VSAARTADGGPPRYQWQPTTAEIAAAAGIPAARVERFDHNTSPLTQDWAAEVLSAGAVSIHEYPAASYIELREAAAAYTGLTPDQVVPGAGADELILLAARALLSSGDTAMQVGPTYPLYEIATAQCEAELISLISPAPGFAFPHRDLIDIVPQCALVWLCSPNNPTGSRLDADQLSAILRAASGVVVVDAAYAEFSGDDWAPLVREHANLLVLRTLSKAFGLAGARVGYGLGSSTIVDSIHGVRPPGSISSTSAALAVAALERPDRMLEATQRIRVWRAQLAEMLEGFGFHTVPADTNFVLCAVGRRAGTLRDGLLRLGLVVRGYPESSRLGGHLRFTVRTPQAHERLRAAIASVLG
jgi:histidinol-phosphate aminotransferase